MTWTVEQVAVSRDWSAGSPGHFPGCRKFGGIFFSCSGDFLANCLRHVRGMSSSPLGFPDEPMDHQVDLVCDFEGAEPVRCPGSERTR